MASATANARSPSSSAPSRSPRTNRPYATTEHTTGYRAWSAAPRTAIASSAHVVISERRFRNANSRKRRDEPERGVGIAPLQRGEMGGPEVVEVAAEAGDVVGLARTRQADRAALGHTQVPAAVAVAQRLAFRVGELVEAELAQGLEQPVARDVGVDELHHRLVDQVGEQRRDLPGREVVEGAHVLDRVEVEPAGEQAQAPEEPALVGRQQVVGPAHEVAQGAVAGLRGLARAGEELESLVEALRERGGAHGAQPRRRELDRERDAVEAAHDLADRVDVVEVEGEAGPGRDRALDEQLDRGRVGGGGRVGTRRARRPAAATVHTCSPAMPSGERLVARTFRSGHHDRSRSTTGAVAAEQVLAVVEHEQRPPVAQVLDQAVLERQVLARVDVERRRDRGGERGRVADGRQLDDEHPVGDVLPELAGDADREARLPDTAGPGQRDESLAPDEAHDRVEVLLAPDEAGGLVRQRTGRPGAPRSPRRRRAPASGPRRASAARGRAGPPTARVRPRRADARASSPHVGSASV